MGQYIGIKQRLHFYICCVQYLLWLTMETISSRQTSALRCDNLPELPLVYARCSSQNARTVPCTTSFIPAHRPKTSTYSFCNLRQKWWHAVCTLLDFLYTSTWKRILLQLSENNWELIGKAITDEQDNWLSLGHTNNWGPSVKPRPTTSRTMYYCENNNNIIIIVIYLFIKHIYKIHMHIHIKHFASLRVYYYSQLHISLPFKNHDLGISLSPRRTYLLLVTYA